jgi:hypothetical protein
MDGPSGIRKVNPTLSIRQETRSRETKTMDASQTARNTGVTTQ